MTVEGNRLMKAFFEQRIGDKPTPEGNLYGTSNQGDAADLGVVFMLTPSGKFKVLHSFQGGTDGANPYSGVALDSAGNLYGSASRDSVTIALRLMVHFIMCLAFPNRVFTAESPLLNSHSLARPLWPAEAANGSYFGTVFKTL